MVKTLDEDLSLIDSLTRGVKPYPISSMCTVFAESEVISLIAKEVPREEILSGILSSIAKRTATFASKLNIEEGVFFSGGVSRSEEFKRRLEGFINKEIKVSPLSQYAGAIGAAIIGYEKQFKLRK
ncbi:R-phenyllactate dehydratase activator [compost metagenome]